MPASVVLDAPIVYEAPDPEVGIGHGTEPATARSCSRKTGARATTPAGSMARPGCATRSPVRVTS